DGGGGGLGGDVAGEMVGVGGRRAREADVTNVDFVQADAQLYEFQPGRFDAIISRFGVMFFADPVAAFANLGKGLREGGRLAFVAWRSLIENEWLMVPGAAAFSVVSMPDLGD